ncbi:MAG: chemotaxis protein CheW [Gemmataceae bacterium]
MSDQARVVRAFANDCVEALDQLDHDVAALEKEPGNQENLGRIAAVVEIIRGDAAQLGFPKLQAITDAGAKLLRKLQSGIATSNSTINTALLAMADAMHQLISDIENAGREGDGDFTGLVEILVKLQEPSADDGFVPRKKQESARRKRSSQRVYANPIASPTDTESLPSIDISEILSPKSRILTPNDIAAESPRYRPLPGRLGGSLVRHGHIRSEDLILALREQETGDRRRVGEILVGLGLLPEESLQDVLRGMSQIATPSVSAPAAECTIAVRSQLLEQIPKALEDLALSLRQLAAWAVRSNDSEGRQLSYAAHQAFGIVQQRFQQTRLQSLNALIAPLQCAVAEAGAAAGKKISLQALGNAADIDQSIVRTLEEPLIAVARILVERVVEMPETRVAAGKPAEAVLVLQFDQTSKEACIRLLADRYEDVDVSALRTLVESHHGDVSITRSEVSELGISVMLPLPATWIDALILESTGENFAIRQDAVHEMVRLGADLSSSAIECVKGSPYLRHRRAAIPLVDLRRVLRSDVLTPFNVPLNVVVLRTGERHFGLLVDRIGRFETILLERRADRRQDADIFAGSAILHDATIALLLDTDRLGRHGGALPAAITPEPTRPEAAKEPANYLMEAADRRRYALSLEPGDRMETITAEAIQFADGEESLLADGDIVPLTRVSSLLGIPQPEFTAPLEVVFCNRRQTAVLLDLPGEISRRPLRIKRPAKTIGIKGSAVVGDRVIDIIDLDALLERRRETMANA